MTTREFQQKKPLSILFTYFKPHRGLFILDLVCATVVALIDLAFPLVTRKSMYDLLPNQQYRTFFIVMGVMMAAFIVRALLYYVISYWGHTFGILVEADIRRDLFTHVQELDVSFFDHNRTGQLMSRLTSDLFEITELAHHGPEDLLISTLTIVGALAILFSIEWRLALVVACILPVFGTPYLVAMVENAAFTYLQQELPEGKSTVGTKVEVSHVSPSPVGMEITVTVEVTDISANGKMVDFKATATDTAGLIGEGTHQRAVITVDRFMDKCQAKLG